MTVIPLWKSCGLRVLVFDIALVTEQLWVL